MKTKKVTLERIPNMSESQLWNYMSEEWKPAHSRHPTRKAIRDRINQFQGTTYVNLMAFFNRREDQ